MPAEESVRTSSAGIAAPIDNSPAEVHLLRYKDSKTADAHSAAHQRHIRAKDKIGARVIPKRRLRQIPADEKSPTRQSPVQREQDNCDSQNDSASEIYLDDNNANMSDIASVTERFSSLRSVYSN